VLFSFYIAFVPQRAVCRRSRFQPLEKTMTDFPRFGNFSCNFSKVWKKAASRNAVALEIDPFGSLV
jgi:hypothetical protein